MPAAAFVPKNTSSGPSSMASLSRTDGAGSIAVLVCASVLAGAFVSRSGCGFILILHACDRARKVIGVERLEILETLADADGVDGKLEALGDRDKDAAPRGTVELGHDEARDASDFLEDLHLIESILPGRGVEHEDDAVRR